ncbi:MAG: glycosyltransferase family 4 protein [Candidatus Omnitrophica bacterium]|nr:glycosyltransferase family 4 protein [Candidatus Omnitrophota bacterium]
MKVAIIDPGGFTMPYDHHLCTSLSNQGIDTTFLTIRQSRIYWHNKKYNRIDHFYRLSSRLFTKSLKIQMCLKGIEHFGDMARLLKHLRQCKPDIIHFQWLCLAMIDVFFLKRMQQIAALVLTVHDSQPYQGSPSSIFQLLSYRKAIETFRQLIVHTDYSKNKLIDETGVRPDKVTVIPFGSIKYQRPKENLTLSDLDIRRPKQILFFGFIKSYKGLDILIEAFSMLPKDVLETACLQIKGYPKMSVKPLVNLVTKLNLAAKVKWDLRFISEEEVFKAFQEADIVVLPYTRIDQSAVLMTAWGFNKPVIATRIGGFREIIKDRINGLLVEPGNRENLRDALHEMISNPELITNIREEIRSQQKQSLSWHGIAIKTINLYNRIAKEELKS